MSIKYINEINFILTGMLMTVVPAVMAEATVYGQAGAWLENSDRTGNSGGTSGVDVKQDNRLGFKRAEDLGGGLTAIYKSEFQTQSEKEDTSDEVTLRDQYVGVSGNFGKVLLGRMELPTAVDESSYTDDAAAYVSPKNSGLQAIVSTLKGSHINSALNDESVVKLTYKNGPLDLSIGMHDQKTNSSDRVHVGTGDTFGSVQLGSQSIGYGSAQAGIYTSANEGKYDSTVAQDNAVDLAASYKLGNNVLKVVHSRTEAEDSDAYKDIDNEITQTAIELEHKLSKRTSAYVNFNDHNGRVYDEEQLDIIGLIHGF